MKKDYQKPAMRIERIEHLQIICTSIESNAGFRSGGGGSGPARARSFGGWDDEYNWDE